MRRAEAKIGLLREVIERVQRGENVDVEGALGTGDPEAEREWAEGESTRWAEGILADFGQCFEISRKRKFFSGVGS